MVVNSFVSLHLYLYMYNSKQSHWILSCSKMLHRIMSMIKKVYIPILKQDSGEQQTTDNSKGI